MRLVTIIIVNWNGFRWLPGCFASVYQQDYDLFEVVFVDNASSDESVAWVKENYPATVIIENGTNRGYADANNQGYKAAKGDYVLFLNNDTRVTRSFLTELLTVLDSDSEIGGAQSRILLLDDPKILDSVGAFLTPTGFLYHYGFGDTDQAKYHKVIDLYTAKGACMMFKRHVLEAVAIDKNVFDPDYFAYFEESDMCHRVWLAGYRVVFAYNSIIYHKVSATSNSMSNAFIQYHSFKNRIRTYLKNLSPRWLVIILPAHLLLCEGISAVSFVCGRIALSAALQKAIGWNIKKSRETLKLRRTIQRRIRKRKDAEIMKAVMRYPSIRYYIKLYLRVGTR
jgi:GT2 family glycosyltransferase